jgi:hypothetical protein
MFTEAVDNFVDNSGASRGNGVQYCCGANCLVVKQINASKFSTLEWMTRKRHARESLPR